MWTQRAGQKDLPAIATANMAKLRPKGHMRASKSLSVANQTRPIYPHQWRAVIVLGGLDCSLEILVF